ncbi:MAG: sigma-54 dependent transcriptional regulator [Methylococcales bacterium]|nr:sigma-54 dependent transcriptional regulator [Methylococcales bacterium]MDD5631293.1 sigma-54 dependent transcriptional regulator [Methylococcales bacterium]
MGHFKSIIGQSPALDSLIRSARMVAATDVTVLIKGETGTGKEVFANAIQKESRRADKAFITLNCAALPESLIESELFGHKKGSFTGATANTQGLFQAADGGTIFLDEINSLPISIQAKLLRFLESGECLAVGDIKPYNVDVRIIAATNSDLNKQVEAGQFRLDLFYRLNVVPLELPPLEQRTEDIEHLIRHFLIMMSETHSIEAPKFSKQTLKVLKDYPWPGNIRELRNLCERLSILLAGRTIEPENLPREFVTYSSTPKAPDFTLPERGIKLDCLEADLIHQALSRTQGNRSKSAKLLGLSRDSLLYRIQKHGLSSH